MRLAKKKDECQHIYWTPNPSLRRCYKCDHEVILYPRESYSMEEFRKMYPLKED